MPRPEKRVPTLPNAVWRTSSASPGRTLKTRTSASSYRVTEGVYGSTYRSTRPESLGQLGEDAAAATGRNTCASPSGRRSADCRFNIFEDSSQTEKCERRRPGAVGCQDTRSSPEGYTWTCYRQARWDPHDEG